MLFRRLSYGETLPVEGSSVLHGNERRRETVSMGLDTGGSTQTSPLSNYCRRLTAPRPAFAFKGVFSNRLYKFLMSATKSTGKHLKSPPNGRTFAHDQSGVVAVEFAIIAIPFFFLTFAIIETALATAADVLLNDAVNEAAREVLIGDVQEENVDAESFKNKICGGIRPLMSCDRLSVDLRTFPAGERISPNLVFLEGSVDSSGFCFDPGQQDSITVLRAYYEWPWTTGLLNRLADTTNGNAVLTSMAAFMNEPFGEAVNSNADC